MKTFAILALSLTLHAAAQMPAPHPGGHVHTLGPASTALTVSIDGKARTLTLADLQALPQSNVVVFDKATQKQMTWTGPQLTEVFAACGMPFTQETQHDVLHRYVIATGTDNYTVVFSAAEMIKSFAGADSIVAIQRDGQPLGKIGQFALFHSTDLKPARRVSNLNSLILRTATP